MFRRILRGVKKHGPFGSMRAAHDLTVKAPRERRRRPRQKPTLKELVRATASIATSAEELLEELGVDVDPELSHLADERVEEVERRTLARELRYPERFAVERESARLLYLLVRATRPDLMVETGVANGASTLLILTAMEENSRGRLVSTDLTECVGSLLTEEERASDRWELRAIDPGGFEAVVGGLGPVDIFLHDSDHSYGNVRTEVEAAWREVRAGGLVLADDGELSFGFLDAVGALDPAAKPYALFDRRKFLMAARR